MRVVPHDPRWATLFADESERIRTALEASALAIALAHMGSTAVRGLPAKPILDLLGGWYHDEDREALIAAIERAGYVHRGEQGIPGREFFRRGEPRQYHLHLARFGGVFWQDHLGFRDLLRTDRTVADAYAALKQELARTYPRDRELYNEGKTSFVHESLRNVKAARSAGHSVDET